MSLRHYALHIAYSALCRFAGPPLLIDTITPNATDGLGAIPVGEIDEVTRHISKQAACAAERRTIDRFAAALFETRRGEVMDGTVSSVTGFGLFIRLGDGAADGLLPMRALPDDFYDFNEDSQSLEGRHNGWLLMGRGSPCALSLSPRLPEALCWNGYRVALKPRPSDVQSC